MLPFESYPGHGRQLLGRVRGDNCRGGYGPELMKMTGQTACAYCGMSLVETYEVWLQMQLDHALPASVGRALSIPVDWYEDWFNRVLSCATCNIFDNRWSAPAGLRTPQTLDEFCELRDAIFQQRRERVMARHLRERELFARKLWQSPSV